MFERAYKLTTGFPGLVLSATVVLVAAAALYAAGIFSDLSTNNGFNATGTEAAAVAERVSQDFPGRQPTAIILFRTYDASLHVVDATYQHEVTRLLAPLVSDGAKISGYYQTQGAGFVSNDKQATFVTVTLAGNDAANYRRLENWHNNAFSPYVTSALGGTLVADQQSSKQVEADLRLAEIITLPLLAVLLLFIFRGVVAAALPLVLGIISILGGIAVVRLLANVTAIDQYALNIITVLGLGLSVDYSLLMVSRFREELNRTSNVRDAVKRTVMTAGRTIFFSGLTVIASLLSLVVFPIGFLRSIGYGGSSAIIVAVVAALVVLPAMLMLIGRRIDAWSIGRLPAGLGGRDGWRRLATSVTRHPWMGLGVSLVMVAALAWPLMHVTFTASNYKTLPREASSRDVAQALVTDFPSGSAPLQVLFMPLHDPLSATGIGEIYDVSHHIKADVAGVTDVQGPTPLDEGVSRAQYQAAYTAATPPSNLAALAASTVSGHEVLLTVTYGTGEPTDAAPQRMVTDLRGLDSPDGTLRVGGEPADFHDTVAKITHYLPVAGSIIAVAMLVLLGLLLRSLVIPLQAMVINGFGLLASFGVLVFVFQQGHFTSYAWLTRTDGLTLTIPLLVFGVAFGLSIDYGAFLYSRMREERDAGATTKDAIIGSLSHTGSIITSAALLLFVVVAAFMSSKVAFLQQVGVGLSVAVLVDAFVIRLLLVPSVMTLFGETNWYSPRWMARWRIRHE